MTLRRPRARDVMLPSQNYLTAPCVTMTIVLQSCRERPDITDGHTKQRRRSHDLTKCILDGLMMDTRWTRWTHEVNTNMSVDLRHFFNMPNILSTLPKLPSNPYNTQPEVAQWIRMHSRMACSWSVPMLQISLIVCPSRVKIGTVWRVHSPLRDLFRLNFSGFGSNLGSVDKIFSKLNYCRRSEVSYVDFELTSCLPSVHCESIVWTYCTSCDHWQHGALSLHDGNTTATRSSQMILGRQHDIARPLHGYHVATVWH